MSAPEQGAQVVARDGAARPGGRHAVLYISYDGLAEPLGQSQVHSYLRHLARSHALALLSYEKAADLKDRAAMRALGGRLASEGIGWIRLRYHKRPTLLATGWDILAGIARGWAACRARGVRLIHARGYVPATIGLVLARLCRAKCLFDMRGFWADEKLEAGHWSRGDLAYRLAKRCERLLFERADAIVSLTEAGVREFPSLGYRIPPGTPIVVIPTCVDTARFAPGAKDPVLVRRLGLEGRVVIGCVGTLSGWYLRNPMLDYLAAFLRRVPQAKAVIVTREAHQPLRAEASAAGIPEARLVLSQARFEEMPGYLRLMDIGLFFIRPCFSKKGSAATKLAEFLATGIPVIINDGIGDSGGVIEEHRAGVVLRELTPAAFEASLSQVEALLQDPERQRRCREAACRNFDLAAGVGKYRALYERLTNGKAH